MNRNQRIALAELDLQVKDLARLVNKHAAYITNVLAGHHKTPKLRAKISQILGKPESWLWPEKNKKMAENGNRRFERQEG